MKNLIFLLLAFALSFTSFAVVGPISGPSSICIGNSVNQSDTSIGGVWSSSNPAVASIGSTTGIITGIVAGTVTISYTVGINYATQVITVKSLPNTYIVTGGGAACAGGMGAHIGLNGSDTGTNYLIFNGGTIVALPVPGTGTELDLGIFPPGIYIVVGENPSGCNIYMSGTATISEITAVCTGTPKVGTISASSTTICTDNMLNLNLPVLECGVSYQWQTSTVGTTWANIPGATTVPYTFTPTLSQYYRAMLTCASSGLVAYSGSVYVTINSSIQLLNVINVPDTVCNGPVFQISTCSYVPGLNATTYFGDGSTYNTVLTSSNGTVSHVYSQPGTYSVKQVLYNYLTPVDSAAFSYEYLYCRTLPVKLFYDANNDSLFDNEDMSSLIPVSIEIDSNSVPIDTISATSAFYYNSSGSPGTVYSFRIISMPEGFHLTCPSSGVLYDTIQTYVNNYQAKYFGFNCGSGTSYDLAEYASLKCGYHMASGIIIVNNSSCTPESATLTVNYSPKYAYEGASPLPTFVTATSITWNLGTLSASLPQYPIINFLLSNASTYLTIGDTIVSNYSITPTIGDADTTNNFTTRIDTVKAGYDPNEMSVTPQGNILPCTPLQYTINFENTGNAPATNIYVMDTLSDNLDPHNLKIIAASAQMNISMVKDGVHNIVRFDFPGINLLDSSHHGRCNGMVIFTVKTKNGLANSTPIYNYAGIFFDDNPVVLTDTAENIIGISPITGADHVCNTASTLLKNATGGGIWNSSNSNATIVAGMVTGVAMGTDIITYTVTNACTSESAIKTITIDPAVLPALTISASPTEGDSICAGTMTTFTPLPLNGGSLPTYQWKVNGYIVDSSNTYSYIPSNGDVITSRLASSTNCAIPDTALSSITMTVLSNVIPLVSIASSSGSLISVGQTDTFIALVSNTGASPLFYQWNINGSPFIGATSSSLIYNGFFNNDVLTCNVTANDFCGSSSESNSVTITLSDVGVFKLNTNGQELIYPNPAQDELTIEYQLANNEDATLQITDVTGRIVAVKNLSSQQQKEVIDISGLIQGIYFYKVVQDNLILSNGKLIKE